MISVLLPSRGRPDSLARSVASLRDNANCAVQVLVAADPDDPATAQNTVADKTVVAAQRYGYSKLHRYFNELAELADGGWLLLWNDDALMLTKDWDATIEALPRGVLVAHVQSQLSPAMSCFPAVRREAVDAVGGFCPHTPHADTYWQQIGQLTGTIAMVGVHVNHDRADITGGHKDQTRLDAMAGYRSREYFALPMQEKIIADAAKVSWLAHVAAWSHPPVDDVGYPDARDLARRDDLKKVVETMRATRYGGWRNHGGRWRDLMGLDSTTGKRVIDYGCGVGVEALELAEAGNTVTLADISADNLALASKVLDLYGHRPAGRLLVDRDGTTGLAAGRFDVFHCNGVLHHSRTPRLVMEEAHRLLAPNGLVRLMVYSDRGWRTYIGTEPPDDVTADRDHQRFVRTFDAVGNHADWYDRGKLERMFGDLFTVERCEYLTDNDRYLGAVLQRRN